VFRVVIVEDSDWIRKGLIYSVPWPDFGFTVVASAADGQEGYDLVRETAPDLVLLDIKMPRLDGLSMMERLREINEPFPEFIIISGYDDFAFTRRAIVLGARDYLLKPIADDELAAVLKRTAESLRIKDSARRMRLLLDRRDFAPEFVAFFGRLMDESVKKDDLAGYAVRRIEERFDTDIGPGDVASELGVSESTLGKRFKRVTGYSFVEYATMVRVMKALEFLADPNCRVNEVANRVGISDSRYFSLIFKRETGYTPSAFRKIAEGDSIGEREEDGTGGRPAGDDS
jgi:two-component system, response regulator YesN